MLIGGYGRSGLLAVSPAALAGYARATGWRRSEPYRLHSDIYVGDGRPDIIVPRTERLGDYASIVAALVETFANVVDQDQVTVYRSLVTSDRDVLRLKTSESHDGSVGLDDGVSLIGGARDLLLAAACSLREVQPVYRAGENRDAVKIVKQVRIGQTEPGSFVITLLMPVVPPPVAESVPSQADLDMPTECWVTRQLFRAITAAREAVERANAGDDSAFYEAMSRGVSANLCEALVRLIEPFPVVDCSVSWARTRPIKAPSPTVRFGRSDVPILREAAHSFRRRAPRPDTTLYGFVRLLARAEDEDAGTIRLTTKVDGQRQSVKATLARADYERSVRAHRDGAMVVLLGDLERIGQRWHMLSSHLVDVIGDEKPQSSDQ